MSFVQNTYAYNNLKNNKEAFLPPPRKIKNRNL